MSLLHRRYAGMALGLFLLMAVVLAACTPDATSEIISPELGPRLVAAQQGMVVVAEPTPVPPQITELSQEEITAGLPEDFVAALAAADPANGETLALSNGCVGCHNLDPTVQMTGPTWYDIADVAVTRAAGESPGYYLYASIVAPGDYIVDGYPAGIMPANYSETISQEDLADLVAYLLAQHVE